MTAMKTNDSVGLTKTWIALAGVVLVLVGILGFVPNPLVGSADGALVPTDALHNIVHLGTGLLALYIAFGLTGMALVNGVIGFGVLYAVIFWPSLSARLSSVCSRCLPTSSST